LDQYVGKYIEIGGEGGEERFVENSSIEELLVSDFHLDVPKEHLKCGCVILRVRSDC
jgi:hypothetical protein